MLVQRLNNHQQLNELVQVEKIQLLFRQSFPAVFLSIINATLITTMLWQAQEKNILVTWLGVIIGLGLSRLFLFLSYRKLSPAGDKVLAWEKPYFVTLLLSSVAWGIGGMFIMPQDSVMFQIVVFTFLIAMAGGAISIYSTHCLMTLSTVFALLLPITIWFFFKADIVFTGLAIGSVLFIISAIRATRSISSTLHQNLLMKHELRKSKEAAEALARIDELTGLYNRRAFYEQGKTVISHARRNNEELSLIMIDIDHFKRINDRFGHAMGDTALRKVGKILRQRLRESDIAARVGGEEFAILLLATGIEQARNLAEELRVAFAGSTIKPDETDLRFTVSLGVASDTTTIDSLAGHADEALYNAKAAGRNTVICYRNREEQQE